MAADEFDDLGTEADPANAAGVLLCASCGVEVLPITPITRGEITVTHRHVKSQMLSCHPADPNSTWAHV